LKSKLKPTWRKLKFGPFRLSPRQRKKPERLGFRRQRRSWKRQKRHSPMLKMNTRRRPANKNAARKKVKKPSLSFQKR